MKILGISAYYHDSAVALVDDGEIVFAAQEERFTRRKHDAAFPRRALEACLQTTGTAPAEIDSVVFYEKPLLKFERLLQNYLTMAPRGFRSFRRALPVWAREKLFQKDLLRRELDEVMQGPDWSSRLLFAEHHVSHAASAFYPSPFAEAVVLTMDGVGEWSTTSVALGRGRKLEIVKELVYPHSLGLLYSAFTYYTGFRVNSGEYKLMGLAPYGSPRYTQTILDHLIDLKEDGSFRLDLSYFDYCTGLTMTNERFDGLFGGPARGADELLTQRHMDLAASVQEVLEIAMLRMTAELSSSTGVRNLCLSGGVALNCVANGKILRAKQFDRLWIQPAAGDAGGALGAALAGTYLHHGRERGLPQAGDGMRGAYLGPAYGADAIERELQAAGARYEVLADDELFRQTVEALDAGKAVGWFQGRMEFGPRALGGRSILGDPRSRTMQSLLNLKVKFRESFRPFAPSVLAEDCPAWFELDEASPYMLLVADVVRDRRIAMTSEEEALFGIEKLNVPRSEIPAVTHVDYSARVQTVHKETNARYYRLLSDFKARTGCPVLVNTSFNVRGEPIVCTPLDAFRCFMGTDIEVLVIGNAFLRKEEQDETLRSNYQEKFELD